VPNLPATANTTDLLKDKRALLEQITRKLNKYEPQDDSLTGAVIRSPRTSAVLFLLGTQPPGSSSVFEPCLILNKRSKKVKQAGDLCCPGGSISFPLDRCVAGLLGLPGFPLSRWAGWSRWRRRSKKAAGGLAILLAAGLREGLEEMRLNPLGVKFLGPLPPQRLTTFDRVIYPLVGWVFRKQRFVPNWEVEKMVYIPLKKLLDPSNYACCRIRMNAVSKNGTPPERDMPCFIHGQAGELEQLWGATYRIAMAFIAQVFGFKPPAIENLPVVHNELDENYRTGSADEKRLLK